jgi:hypothetical protein
MGLLGIAFGLLLLPTLAFRSWSVLLLAPAAALVAAVFAGATEFVAPFVLVAWGRHAVAQIWAVTIVVMAVVFWFTTKDDPVYSARRARCDMRSEAARGWSSGRSRTPRCGGSRCIIFSFSALSSAYWWGGDPRGCQSYRVVADAIRRLLCSNDPCYLLRGI